MRAAVRASACAGCRGQRLAGLTLSPVQFANRRGRRWIRAGDAARQDLLDRAGAKYQVYRPFSGSRRGGRLEIVSITGRATPEIAGLREKYNIGVVDRAVINASGRHPADFEAMPKPDHSLWGGSGP
jgi:hypothetical protein